MLPGVDQFDADNENELERPGSLRHVHRVREIAIQTMVQATAQARAQRALNTRTLPAGQTHEYHTGDLFDFWTDPGSRDFSGWRGPARIIDMSQLSHGTIGIKHGHHNMERTL